MKRRNLVLTTESARNPFRASLPPHVFTVPKVEPEVDRLMREKDERRAEVVGDIKAVSIICCFGLMMSYLQPAGF